MLRLLRRVREQTDDEVPPGVLGLTPGDLSVIYVESSVEGDVHANKRAELYARLAEFIQKPDTILPDDRALLQELASVTYFHNGKGLLALDPKAKIRSRLALRAPATMS